MPRSRRPPAGAAPFEIRHGTTIAAIRYADGVVMVGDRRATAGSSIAHRTMEKVHPADRHSGVAIAGAAGPAMEMVRLFQLQLEHYEKVEGAPLSLEGKANQLSQMVRSNLAMALQGFVVVPLFAGFDVRRGVGRIYTYDPTGGRYEETDFHADGSGGRDARTTIKLGWQPDLSRADAIALAVRALWQAADEDSATGGPDAVRGIYPTVATITAAGFAPGRGGRGGRALRGRGRRRRRGPAMSMPFYVAPEQFMKDKADFARKNIARGRPLVATVYAERHPDLRREPVQVAAQGERDLRPHRLRRRRPLQRVRLAAPGRGAARRHQGLPVQPGGRRRPLPRQPVRPVHGQRLHPRDEAARGGDPGRRGRDRRRRRTSCSTSSTTGRSSTRTATRCSAARRTPSPARLEGAFEADWDLDGALRAAAAALAGPDRTPVAADLEVAVLARSNGRRAFQRLDDDEVGATLQNGASPAGADGAPSPPD